MNGSGSDGQYFQGDTLMAKHGDKVKLNGNVIFTHATSSSGFSVGRILEILISDPNCCSVTHVAIQLFKFESALHPTLHLPKLCLTAQKVVVSCTISVFKVMTGDTILIDIRTSFVLLIYSTIVWTPSV